MNELMLIVEPNGEMPRPKKIMEVQSIIGGVNQKIKVMKIIDLWWGKDGKVVVCFSYKEVK